MVVYHGSKVIVEEPAIRIAKFHKDFGFGFYCTVFPQQAVRWATRFDGVGILNEYEYTPNSALFYTCSLLELIGRERKLKRSKLVQLLGYSTLDRIYRYADVLHCEPIEKTADDFIEMCYVPE